MKKILAPILLAGLFAATLPLSAKTLSAHAEEEEETPVVNLFENESDWKHNKEGSTDVNCVTFEDGKLVVTPHYVIGSTYCGRTMGEGRISFTYKVSYPWLEDTTEEDLEEAIYDVENGSYFFGVTFLNAPVGAKGSGTLAIPFNAGAGGFPYMVAFDSERQNSGQDPDRDLQLGLTLRRYKYDGSHDYTRWSSVHPTDAQYVNSSGVIYDSKIPDYYSPVTIADCFDFDEHKVDIDVKNLFTENGDEKDAVQIEVYFDNELALRVIDEMPYESDSPSGETDKREADGWISVYAHGGTEDTGAPDNYTVTFTSFTAQFRGSNGGNGGSAVIPDDNTGDNNNDNTGDNSGTTDNNGGTTDNTDNNGGTTDGTETKKKGCGSDMLGAVIPAGLCVLAGAAIVTVLIAKRKKED